MKKVSTISIISISTLCLIWFFFSDVNNKEQYIKKEINEANYCQVVSDCQMVTESKCPFGCYVFVNKNESTRIGELLEEYESNCAYSCIEFKGVECVSNSCQILE